MKPLTAAQLRITAGIRNSTDEGRLRWEIWKWQKELKVNRRDLAGIESKLAKLDRALVCQRRQQADLRALRLRRQRRRKHLIMWVGIALARADDLHGMDRDSPPLVGCSAHRAKGKS